MDLILGEMFLLPESQFREGETLISQKELEGTNREVLIKSSLGKWEVVKKWKASDEKYSEVLKTYIVSVVSRHFLAISGLTAQGTPRK